MSYIEAFLGSNPVDMSLRTKVVEELAQDGTNQTPLMFFASEFALAGSAGLQLVAKTVTDRGIVDQTEFTYQLSERGKQEMSAIIWGSLYREIQNCVKDGVFDTGAVIGNINFLTRDAGVEGLTIPTNSVELIKPVKMSEIRITHQIDPTDALFFLQPFHLPDSIRKVLAESGFFSSKEALSVVEAWKERAEIIRGIPTEEFDRSHRLAIEELLQSLEEV